MGRSLRGLIGEAIGQSLSLAVGVALSQVPNIAARLCLVIGAKLIGDATAGFSS